MARNIADFSAQLSYHFESSADAKVNPSLILGDSAESGTAQIYWPDKSYPAYMVDSTFEVATAKQDLLALMAATGPLIFMNGLRLTSFTGLINAYAPRPRHVSNRSYRSWTAYPVQECFNLHFDAMQDLVNTDAITDIRLGDQHAHFINSLNAQIMNNSEAFYEHDGPFVPLFLYDTFVGLDKPDKFMFPSPNGNVVKFKNDHGEQPCVVNCYPGFHKALVYRKDCGKHRHSIVSVSTLLVIPDDVVPAFVCDVPVEKHVVLAQDQFAHMVKALPADVADSLKDYHRAGTNPTQLAFRFIWLRKNADNSYTHVSNRELCKIMKSYSVFTATKYQYLSTHKARDMWVTMKIKGGKHLVRELSESGYEDGRVPGDWFKHLLSKYGVVRRNIRAPRKDRNAGKAKSA